MVQGQDGEGSSSDEESDAKVEDEKAELPESAEGEGVDMDRCWTALDDLCAAPIHRTLP